MAHAPSIARLIAKGSRVGPFRIVAELGEGGFAPVFLAVEEHGDVELRSVALKLFDLEALAEAESKGRARGRPPREQVIAEARALCRVEHPGIVRFLQLVEQDSVLALAMEHVQGRSLQDRLDEEGRLPLDKTLTVGAEVASSLAAVHAAGLIHRDVKPANVIDVNGRFKLIDFGIAAYRPEAAAEHRSVRAPAAAPRALPAEDVADRDTLAADDGTLQDRHATPTAAVAGTMGYIDPECLANGEPATSSSDLYALGAMLYECLSGRLPASVGTGAESSRLRLHVAFGREQPPPLVELAPEVPADVAKLVDALVAPRREDRPQRVEWVASEIERLRRAQPGKDRALRELPKRGPFRGLEPFSAEDRDIYLGRATDTSTALELLRQRGAIALVGPSGSGKTSFVRAALAPAIEDGALGAWPERWRAAVFSPGLDPDAALRRELASHVEGEIRADAPGIVDRLARDVEASAVGLLLVVDALEEIVTLGPPERAPLLARFIEEIEARPRPGLRLVVAARRDMLDGLLALAPLGRTLTRGALLLQPLSGAALVACMEERLEAYGYRLEDPATRDDLVAEITKTAESMPLAEFALARLWKERDETRRVLPRAALARIGGVAGALEQHAEATLAELAEARGPAAIEATRWVLLALTTPRGTRRRRATEDLAKEVTHPERDAVVEAFARARFVVRDEGTWMLAHEALLAQWSRLAAWVESARRDRELAEDVERAAGRWRAQPRRDLLLRGRALAEARRLGDRGIGLTDDARAFLVASTRFDRRTTIGVVALASSVVLAAIVFYEIDTAAERRANEAKSEAVRFVAPIVAAQNVPESERRGAMKALIEAKTRCEKALEAEQRKASADAGAP